jgi:HAMP domain-containing protein
MNTGAKWGIGLGVGIPGVFILIGLIVYIIKFFMKRFREKAWDEISTLPKHISTADNSTSNPKTSKRSPSEREPLYPSATNSTTELSNRHIVIPIDEHDLPPSQREAERAKQHDHTLVQIQRDRLNRLKEDDNRLKPMITSTNGENGMQKAIDKAQEEFEESV